MSVTRANEFVAAWRILCGCFVGIGVGVSSLYFYSLGVFIKPLAAEFGWSRGQASLGALVGTTAAALMSPLIGNLVDRIGSLRVALGSLLLLAAGFFAHGAFIAGLTSFLVITFVVSLVTAGSSPIPYSRLTVQAFERHRGLALGVILGGTGLGATLIPRLLVPYVAVAGWRAGYTALGVVVMIGIGCVALLLRGTPDAARSSHAPMPIATIVGHPAFALLAAMFLLAAIAILGTVVQFVPMLTDAGLSPARAGGIAAIIGVAAISGRLGIGWLLDRVSPGLVTVGLFSAASIGLLTLALGGVEFAVPGAAVTGFAVGAEVDLLSFLTARYFPRSAFGQVNGLLYALFLAGGAIGPALSGALFDFSGDYRLSLCVASGLLFAAAMVGMRLPRESR